MMTEYNLDALWQSESPGPETEEIMLHIELEERSQHQLGWVYIAVCAMGLMSAAYVEWVQALKVPGLMMAIMLFGVACTWVSLKARKRKEADTAGMSPRAMLEHALTRAQYTLELARALQFWLPGGGVAGFLVTPFLSNEGGAASSPAWVDNTVISVIAVVMIVSITVGTLIARDAKYRIGVLQRRIDELDADA